MSSEFFNSPIVRASAVEINELQEEMMKLMMNPPWGQTSDDKRKIASLMTNLLEKQKVFWFRLKYSDDPEAKKMKEDILESARFLGLKPSQTIESFFDELSTIVEKLENTIDN